MGEYEGWPNYETWAVNLWLSNDQALYYEAREHSVINADVYADAEGMKDWVEDMMPDLDASLWTDLLRHALGRVEWVEIVRSFRGDDEEED